MSKRSGEFVTLDELIDDIGVDAARFFLMQRSSDTALDLDLELARSQSQDNPVYYVQYAHARIASILRKAAVESGVEPEAEIVGGASADGALGAACEPAERELVRRLLELPGEVEQAASKRAPAPADRVRDGGRGRLPRVLQGLPGSRRRCRGGRRGLEAARLGVCLAAKRVIAQTLGLLGVSAPERM